MTARMFNKKGFTLIELVVVFTVIAILSTIGTVSLVSYSLVQALNQVTSDLLQTLNTAKSLSASQLKSLSKNGKTLQCLDSQTLGGYGVRINTTQNYYALYIQCVANSVSVQNTSSEWQTSLSSNGDIVFDSATNIADVFFPILSGGIITKGSGNADTIAIKSYGQTKKISLKNGYISISQ
jgi:prepilin-type N-terminal cleavage/methylation domain-containing protein